MAKIKDILKIVNEQISSNELSAALSASNLNDVEVTDEGFKEIKEQVEGLLTVEAAQTNPLVKKALAIQHKKTFLTEFEGKLKVLADKLGLDSEFTKAEFLDDKISLLVSKLDEKPDPSEDKEVLKKYKKDIAELNTQIIKLQEEKESEITAIKTGFETERVKNAFKSKLSNYKLADAYEKDLFKNTIFEKAFQEVSEKAILKFDDKGELVLLDKETPDKPYYIKNKPAGIDDLVAPIFQDYLKVSEPQKPNSTPQTLPNQEVFKPGTFAFEMAQAKQRAIQGMTN